jgi:glucokinase
MKSYMIGVDIGGTSIHSGVFDTDGQLVSKWAIRTNKENNGASIVEDLSRSIEEKLNELQLKKSLVCGIGVGVPAFIDRKSGFIDEAVNIGWKNFPLKDEIESRLGIQAFIENDANIAALGERWKGAGNGSDDLIVMTLGTGVGGGIIANGKMIVGASSMGGEIGHYPLDPKNGLLCNCGKYGCLETFSSATGIVRQAMMRVERNPTGRMAKVMKDNKGLSAELVFQLAEEGDPEATDVVNQAAEALGYMIAALGVICNPSHALIGGGVSQAGEFLLSRIEKSFKKYALPRIANTCKIKRCELGNDAGIFGGAYLIKENLSY